MFRRNSRRACAGALLAWLLGSEGAALAQTAGRQVVAPVNTYSYVLDQISIFAVRGAKQLLDIPQTVTVIGRSEMDQRMVRDIDDLTKYEPGVKVDRQTSRTDPFSNLGGFTIRGVGGNRVLTMVDGTRAIERITDGTRDFIDTSNMKAVEIIRGPASVLWGSDALGGVVAFATKDPDDYLKGTNKLIGGQADTSYDSYDGSWLKSITGAAQTDMTGRLQVLLSVSRRDAHEPVLSKARADGGTWGCPRNPQAIRCNELDPFSLTAHNGLGKVVFRPSEGHEFKLTGEAYDSQTDVDQKYDLGAAAGGITNLSYLRHQHKTRYRGTLSHEWQTYWTFLDSVRWQATFAPYRREFTGERLRRLANGQQDRLNFLHDYQENFWEGDIQLKSHFDFAGITNRFTYGYYGAFTKTDYERRDVTRNLTTGAVTITNAGGFNFANADTTRSDGYLQDEIGLFGGRLIVTPGVRYSYYNLDPRPNEFYKIITGKAPREIEEADLSKKIGAVFKIDERFSVFANYGEGFKMPTAEQLYTSLPSTTFNLIPNPELKPERVKSYEAGLRGKFAGGFFSVSGFYADYDDFILSFQPHNGSAIDLTYVNLSKVKLWGFEIFGEAQIYEKLFVNLAISHQHGNQIASAGAVETPFDGATPLTIVNGLKYLDRNLGLQGELIGTFGSAISRASSDSLFKPGAYAVFDTIWSYKPHKDVTLRFAVNNILDARYWKWPFPTTYTTAPSPASGTNSPAFSNPLELQTQAGRTYRIGATVTF
jgi:hemoglobin/transferrin/lactoferrin receptor protein